MPYPFSARIAAGTVLGGVCLLAPALSALCQPTLSQAAFAPRIGAQSFVSPRGVVGRITINGQPVASLQTPSGGESPAGRALGVKGRLSRMTAAGLTAGGIALLPTPGGNWEVQGGGAPILLVTPREAAAHRQPARLLARAWAKNIKAALAEPALTVSARQLLVPFGQTRRLTVGGAARPGDVSVSGGDARLAATLWSAKDRRITIFGAGSGQTTLSVGADGVSLPVVVVVRKYAAQVQPQITVRVTGRPLAPAALVQAAVYLGLKQALSAEDGAQMRLAGTPRSIGPLRPGASLTRRLALRVSGAGLLPVEAAPRITVVNQPLPPARAEALFYSNNPEQVHESRTLFTGPLSPARTVRLDYHHQSRSPLGLIFHADLVNRGDKPASVHVLSGIAEPAVDTVQVGRRAGAAFLQALDGGVGVVLSVPPHGRVPLVVQRFSRDLTVSGILQLRQISGPDGALSVRVAADGDRQALAASPLRLAAEESDGGATPLTSDFALAAAPPPSQFIFGPPRVALRGAYRVGEQWLHLRLGVGESLRSADTSRTLWGNYGVSYFVTLTLTNPDKAARIVSVSFAPEAGPAAGVFQVSGAPQTEFDPLSPPDERELTRCRLLPGETRTVRLRTILLNGSSYPASLVIHALTSE